MLGTVSLDESIQTAHCSNNSQSVYISTKPSLLCSSNHNSTFRHFINTADLFLIKEFHSSGLWSLNISNPITSLLQYAGDYSLYTSYSRWVTFPPNTALPADNAWREQQCRPALGLCKKVIPGAQDNTHRDAAIRINADQLPSLWEILYLLSKP